MDLREAMSYLIDHPGEKIKNKGLDKKQYFFYSKDGLICNSDFYELSHKDIIKLIVDYNYGWYIEDWVKLGDIYNSKFDYKNFIVKYVDDNCALLYNNDTGDTLSYNKYQWFELDNKSRFTKK